MTLLNYLADPASDSVWRPRIDAHGRNRLRMCLDAGCVYGARIERHRRHFAAEPYLHETRTATETYKHEMTEDEHRELLVAN